MSHPPSRRALLLIAFPLLAPAAVAVALSLGYDPVEGEARAPMRHREDGYQGASTCRACHPDQHASWARTFHSTMTRLPDESTVRGAFDGRIVRYMGRTARTFARDGRYLMEVPHGSGSRVAEVALVVGSRRYQQYFEREPGEGGDIGNGLVRLPILWHIGERRWLPLNAVFLDPDHPDWNQHQARWNENCVFCHNTGPRPGMLRAIAPDGRPPIYDSSVADLGIACESCHGPGARHVERHADPLERFASWKDGEADDTIVHPERLDKERSVSLCGQCHGQRLPRPLERILEWLEKGPSFRSGDLLLDHVDPLTRDTRSRDPARTEQIRLRFWGDGTPRLTAYELQGVLASPCYTRGEMTCLSCHAMHRGDPRGQLRPDRLGDRACTQCHEAIGMDVAAHTRHPAESSGSRCVECHMPRMVYGILDIHRSHRVEIPDPARDAKHGRPNACTLCHLDRSLPWAAREMTRMFGRPFPVPTSRNDAADVDLADSVGSLLAGDPVVRAVYARAMGRPDAALEPEEKGFLRLHLCLTLADAYPSVRLLAKRSLEALERERPIGLPVEDFDHLMGEAARRDAVRAMIGEFAAATRERLAPIRPGFLIRADHTPDMRAIAPLLDAQAERSISIGE